MTLVGQRSFHDLGSPLSEVPFCVLDLETTGVGPDIAEITEIGAARYEHGIETGRFQTLVNPGLAIPPQITVITGITQAMVVDAPRIGEALPAFLEFLGDAVIVGHNVSFDISFLNAASIRLGYGRLPNQSTDTLRLARRLVRKETRSLKLSHLAAHFGSPVTPNHRALDDALATAHVFWSLLERAGSVGVTHLDDLLALPTIKGSRAIGKLDRTERLPRTPGVYRFVDGAGSAIYVGKATNLRARVRSYFGGDTRRRVDDILRDMATVDHTETVNEFEASVLEIREIASNRPIYNRRSKPPKSLHWVRLTNERYPRLQIGRTPGNARAVLGPFRSRRAAELVQMALWDGSRVRRCMTPCAGNRYTDVTDSLCPCTGGLDDQYATEMTHLERTMTMDPNRAFGRMKEKLVRLVDHQRYEDAAAVRDRWAALARALDDRRIWESLRSAGSITAVGHDGFRFHIQGCRLVAVDARDGQQQLPTHDEGHPSRFPQSMVAMEEARLIWSWLMRLGSVLESVTGTLSSPAFRVPEVGDFQATDVPGSTASSGRRSTTPPPVTAPTTSTSDRNPPTRIGSRPATTTTWLPTKASAS